MKIKPKTSMPKLANEVNSSLGGFVLGNSAQL